LIGPSFTLSDLDLCYSGGNIASSYPAYSQTNFATSVSITKPGVYKLLYPIIYQVHCSAGWGCVETNVFISMLDIGPEITNVYLSCGLPEKVTLQPNVNFSSPPYRWTDTSRPGFTTNKYNHSPYVFDPQGKCGTFFVTATMSNPPFASDTCEIRTRKLETATSVVYLARSRFDIETQVGIKTECWGTEDLYWSSQPEGIFGTGSVISVDSSYLNPGPYFVSVTSSVTPGCLGSMAVHALDVILPSDEMKLHAGNPLYRRARLAIEEDSYLADGSVIWTSDPPGISGVGRSFTFSTTNLALGAYTVTARSTILSNCVDTVTVQFEEDFAEYDSDGDGIPDQWETNMGLDINMNDAWWDHDVDGLSALQEYLAGTDPFEADSDRDQMPDAWEVFWQINPDDSSDAHSDFDFDGASNYREFRERTNPHQFPGTLHQVSVAGTFNNWSTENRVLVRTNASDWVGDFILPVDHSEIKFVGNLSWSSGFSWGRTLNATTLIPPFSHTNLLTNGANVSLNIRTAGTYRIYFSTNTAGFAMQSVPATVLPSPPIPRYRYRLAGTFNGWDTASDEFVLYPNDNELHASVLYLTNAGVLEFKIAENETWQNNRGAIDSSSATSAIDQSTLLNGVNFKMTSAGYGFYLAVFDPVGDRFTLQRIDDDADHDGISDTMEEAYYASNPNAVDTDGDGLSDGFEVRHTKTSPTETDTDGDSLLDGWEIEHNLDPLDNGSVKADTVLPGNPFSSTANLAGSAQNGAAGDPDQDGLSNENEQLMGTSASNSDTDGDGMNDGEDYDPNKASCMIKVAMDQPVPLPSINQSCGIGTGQRQNDTSLAFNFNLPADAIGIAKVLISGYVDDGFSVDGKGVEENKHAGGFNADITGLINNRKGPATITVFDFVDKDWKNNQIKFEGSAQIEYNMPVKAAGIPREVCVGETIMTSVAVSPHEAAGEVTFQSGNPAIATVSGNGSSITIHGLAAGVTSIKVLYEGDVCQTYSLKVHGTKVSGPGSMCVGAQETFTAGCGVTPFQWLSSNPQIASVNNGVVTAHQAGSAVISATDASGVRDSIKLKVGSGFDDESPLCVDEVRALLLKCSGATFTEWSSSAPAVATVSPNGELTALSSGATEVRVRDVSGNYISGLFQVVKFTGPEDLITKCWTDGGVFDSYAHIEFDDGHGYTGWDADEAEWSYEKVWGADPSDFNAETGDLHFGAGSGQYKILAHHRDFGCEAVIDVLAIKPTPLMVGDIKGVSCNADIKTATLYETTNSYEAVWVNLNSGLAANDAPDCLSLNKSSGTLEFEKEGPYQGKVSRKSPGWITIESQCCHDSTCEHGKIVIVAGNLKIDSNNDQVINDDDDEIEMDEPGKIIMYNGDDDNADNVPDHEQTVCVPGENDLVPLQITIDNYNDLDDGTEIILEATQGATAIKLWADPEKCQPIPHPAVFKKGVMTPPTTIYVEGGEPGRVKLALQLMDSNRNKLPLDIAHAVVVSVDINEVASEQIPGVFCQKLPTDYYKNEPDNPMLLATRSGRNANLNIKVSARPNNINFIYIGVRKVNEAKILNSKPIKTDGESTPLTFTAYEGHELYEIVAGFDLNRNQILDTFEANVLFEKTPKTDAEGNTTLDGLIYLDKIIVVTQKQFVKSKEDIIGLNIIGTDYAGDLIEAFGRGQLSVPEAITISGTSINSEAPGLSHRVGARWGRSCTDVTHSIIFVDGSGASDDVENSSALLQIEDSVIKGNILALLAHGSFEWKESDPLPYIQSKDFFITENPLVGINELGNAFGKVTIEGDIRVKYRKKSSNMIEVEQFYTTGAFGDIYDFAYGGGGRARQASMVQAGHASFSTDSEPSGKIFFTRVEFSTGWKNRSGTYSTP